MGFPNTPLWTFLSGYFVSTSCTHTSGFKTMVFPAGPGAKKVVSGFTDQVEGVDFKHPFEEYIRRYDTVDAAKAGHKEVVKMVKELLDPISLMDGDSLPVSAFAGNPDGQFELGASAYEKRGTAVTVPACPNNGSAGASARFLASPAISNTFLKLLLDIKDTALLSPYTQPEQPKAISVA